ncbi:hypothetical protein KUCAC02_035456 [Chaenocephalus aceratus]|nr:hypothetical protein KUCAC02_035456 [Chaenocephalus aceratus]
MAWPSSYGTLPMDGVGCMCRTPPRPVLQGRLIRSGLHELLQGPSTAATPVLQAAAECLGLDDFKVKEVKDTRWLSQAMAVSDLQRKLTAVLAA